MSDRGHQATRGIEAVDEPTLEQCENVMHVLGLPTMPEGLRPPYYLESVRNLHALFVRKLNGDEEAGRRLDALVAAFGRTDSDA